MTFCKKSKNSAVQTAFTCGVTSLNPQYIVPPTENAYGTAVFYIVTVIELCTFFKCDCS